MPDKQQLLSLWKSTNVDKIILKAFQEIPREQFVPSNLKHLAYEDRPLPTIRGQSISQPTTVISMLQALNAREGQKVLEIGAGMGYQAALLSRLVGESGTVITIEIIPELVQAARKNLRELKIKNVQVVEGDGGEGYPPEQLYDRIIVTAACPTIPQPIINQLKEAGIVVAPVGDEDSQTMVRGTKVRGRLELEFLGTFTFVPLQGKYGFTEDENVDETA